MKTFLDLISLYPEHVQLLAHSAHLFIKGQLPEIKQEVDMFAKLIGYSYGPGYKGMICTLIFSQKNVKIGFYKGVELYDPQGLLKGTGKVHRHVAVQKEEDLNDALSTLFKEAVTKYRQRQETGK